MYNNNRIIVIVDTVNNIYYVFLQSLQKFLILEVITIIYIFWTIYLNDPSTQKKLNIHKWGSSVWQFIG